MSKVASSLARWRTARPLVLGSILVAGVMATSVAVLHRAMGPIDAQHRITRAVTYSGIGVVIERVADDRVVVREVIPNSPAQGRLVPGAHLVKVNGERPESLPRWANAIRGPAGTDVELEVAYHCGGHQTITLTRDLVRLEY